MASSFASLKKSRQSSLEKLQTEIDKINNPQNNFSREDDRFWKAELDKSGNGYAVIRFLPPSNGEDMPYQRVFNHGFQGPGGWYIENSLTTIGQKDPVSEYNSTLWNSGIEANKEIARKQKRRLNYTANVYIVKDPAHPENEGEVKLFRFGKKIFDKINDLMNPEFEDETPVNPFDLWEGANFKMKIRKVEGYSNYDKSEFEAPSPLLEDDDQMEKIWNTEHSLKEIVSEDKFKTYDELKEKLDKVLGSVGSGAQQATTDNSSVPFDGGKPYNPPPNPAAESSKEDEGMDYFQKLAEEA